MLKFTVHTIESAPQEAKDLLKDSQASFGMIPNLHAVMAEAPTVLDAYKKLHKLALATSFNNEEKTVLWQTVNVEHQCHYCIPAHSAIAHSMKVSEDIDKALRDKSELPNAKLNALRAFTLEVIRNRGKVGAKIDDFINAGYNNQQALEVILFVSQKVMSNYINHFTNTPIDEAFKAFK
ncbi:MAG: carboxymuconolactone decarboxylase family protein [Methyloprofundus sp.]|nr:carboxymuconolactone decarboxylase family protein [Methyloprofundus sp.]MDT8425995.1 carboxymuconolactone decarboxylase family protein [Methyloprofundus sp.]